MESSGFQSLGLFIGNGDQDNYIKLVVNNTGFTGGVELLAELAGDVIANDNLATSVSGSDYADLYLKLNPSTLTVNAYFRISVNGVEGPLQSLGNVIAMPAQWLNAPTSLAVGIISTSNGGTPFPGTWDFIEISNDVAGLIANSVDPETENTDAPENPAPVDQPETETENATETETDRNAVLNLGGGGQFSNTDTIVLIVLMIVALTARRYAAGNRQLQQTTVRN